VDIYEPNDYEDVNVTANITMDSSLVITDVTMSGRDIDGSVKKILHAHKLTHFSFEFALYDRPATIVVEVLFDPDEMSMDFWLTAYSLQRWDFPPLGPTFSLRAGITQCVNLNSA
jgi:hypothetical protein